MNFSDLVNQIKNNKSYLCVGLDWDINKIPKHLKGEILRALEHARRKGKDIPVDFEHRFFK